MAQAFVIRQDLQVVDGTVRVIAAYRNDTVVDRNWHGAQCTVLTVADDKIVKASQDDLMSVLVSDWRDDYKTTINGEAGRRINDVFPMYKQNNYNAQYNQYQSVHGVDPATWPDQAFVAEYSRGWQYVSDVRTTANSFTGMPTDPTDDSIWPVIVAPIA